MGEAQPISANGNGGAQGLADVPARASASGISRAEGIPYCAFACTMSNTKTEKLLVPDNFTGGWRANLHPSNVRDLKGRTMFSTGFAS